MSHKPFNLLDKVTVKNYHWVAGAREVCGEIIELDYRKKRAKVRFSNRNDREHWFRILHLERAKVGPGPSLWKRIKNFISHLCHTNQ